jgi:hypothetical protein
MPEKRDSTLSGVPNGIRTLGNTVYPEVCGLMAVDCRFHSFTLEPRALSRPTIQITNRSLDSL